MPRRAALAVLAALACCTLCACAPQSPSRQALSLRQSLDLVPHAPPPEALSALFTADEDAPRAVYGPVSAYAKARACPSAWLVEADELARLGRIAAKMGKAQPKGAPPEEFSLTLEEDCGDRVTHSVFVFSPGATAEGRLAWRRQFHGSKAPRHYALAQERLRRAEAAGLAPTAELRFVSVNGELVLTSLEDALRAEGRLAPVFDLTAGGQPGQSDRSGR